MLKKTIICAVAVAVLSGCAPMRVDQVPSAPCTTPTCEVAVTVTPPSNPGDPPTITVDPAILVIAKGNY
jgi:hypothetical protein